MTEKLAQELADSLSIEGAKEHNLQNVSVQIPKNKLVVITGLSGSGKSSLAFDTLYAEGQRRYLESFSSYARQFMGILKRPKVEHIAGLSPVIAIEQKTISKNLRSTVGTVTEIYDFLRLLFARVAQAYSYQTGKEMRSYSEQEIVRILQQDFAGQKLRIYAPLVRGRKGHYQELFNSLAKKGYTRVRVDGELRDIEQDMRLSRYKIHNIELLIDTLQIVPNDNDLIAKPRQSRDKSKTEADSEINSEIKASRLALAVSRALELGKGTLLISLPGLAEAENSAPVRSFSKDLLCVDTGISYELPSPNSFSFNLPQGYCPKCKGLGGTEIVDINRVCNAELSIEKGALLGLSARQKNSTYTEIQKLAKRHKISLTVPFAELSKAEQKLMLEGDGKHNGVLVWLRGAMDKKAGASLNAWAKEFMVEKLCEACQGARLRIESLHFKILDQNIYQLCNRSLQELYDFFQDLPAQLGSREQLIARDIIREIQSRLGFLLQVGLGYLCLALPARALSGGEAQRVRLSTQIGAGLQGITYILDEPSIGLHASDNHRLIEALKKLRDLGNTVIVVEHDRDIMLAADYIIDMGPGAGHKGGKVVATGSPNFFCKKGQSLTADFLRASLLPISPKRRSGNGKFLDLEGATGNNLQNVSLRLPLETLIVVSGLSGAGKSTLINDTLYPALYTAVHRIKKYTMPFSNLQGAEFVSQVIQIDQSPIGRTPRSNPATYCGFFTEIRSLFAALPESRARAYPIGRFSFNVKGGRCEACGGAGVQTIEMGFLPAVSVECELCQGKRYNRETLDIRYKGKSINDVLNMEVDEAVEFFKAIPSLARKLSTLQAVGLGYICLGQAATLLSGGEAQRVKLCTELGRRTGSGIVYILDEPTTGLHFKDVEMLLVVLNLLVDKGNTVIVVEHNMDIIKHADFLVDMGPCGGKNGGKITAQGSPEQVVKLYPESPTAEYLAQELAKS